MARCILITLHIPREVCAALFKGSVPWLVSEGLMGGKGGSHIYMPHSTPALPSVIMIPGAQGPAPTPTQSKPQGAKGTCV